MRIVTWIFILRVDNPKHEVPTTSSAASRVLFLVFSIIKELLLMMNKTGVYSSWWVLTSSLVTLSSVKTRFVYHVIEASRSFMMPFLGWVICGNSAISRIVKYLLDNLVQLERVVLRSLFLQLLHFFLLLSFLLPHDTLSSLSMI